MHEVEVDLNVNFVVFLDFEKNEDAYEDPLTVLNKGRYLFPLLCRIYEIGTFDYAVELHDVSKVQAGDCGKYCLVSTQVTGTAMVDDKTDEVFFQLTNKSDYINKVAEYIYILVPEGCDTDIDDIDLNYFN